MENVLLGWIFFNVALPKQDQLEDFASDVKNLNRIVFNVTTDSKLSAHDEGLLALHDAIMLYAHAVTAMLSQGGDLRDGKEMTAAVRNTTFTGVGGSLVALDSNGDRVESYEVMNYVQGEGDVMISVAVGMFNSTQGHYRAYARQVVWPGNTLEVPTDYFSGEC